MTPCSLQILTFDTGTFCQLYTLAFDTGTVKYVSKMSFHSHIFQNQWMENSGLLKLTEQAQLVAGEQATPQPSSSGDK